MPRYVIIGAGAVGASLAAELEAQSINYVLVGRGAQIAHIQSQGLTYRRPKGTQIVRLNAVDGAASVDLTGDDILVLAVKTQDVEAALSEWAWKTVEGGGFATDLPLVTIQNGLAAEEIAIRRFSRVYAASVLVPARFTVTGEVVVGGEPNLGILTLGRFPQGVDDLASAIVADFARAGYLAETSSEIRRWKSAKLKHNVTNATELFAGTPENLRKAASALSEEAHRVLISAGYDPARPEERKIDISSWRIAEGSGIERGQQSTWQSFARGTSHEVDYLNGEVVRLARLHNAPAPLNASIQRAVAKLARDGSLPGTVDIAEVLAAADHSPS
jgi:2-dehydropantoate 2-reductase